MDPAVMTSTTQLSDSAVPVEVTARPSSRLRRRRYARIVSVAVILFAVILSGCISAVLAYHASENILRSYTTDGEEHSAFVGLTVDRWNRYINR